MMKQADESDALLQPTLHPILQAHTAVLKQQLIELEVPNSIERDLMAAFDKQFPKKTWWQRLSVFQWRIAGGVAASLFAVMVLVKTPVPMNDNQAAVVQDQDSFEDIPFLALGSGETILRQDSMRVVQADVPYTVLASMGVAVNPQMGDGYSKAEMLMGANDELLAVRFLPI